MKLRIHPHRTNMLTNEKRNVLAFKSYEQIELHNRYIFGDVEEVLKIKL